MRRIDGAVATAVAVSACAGIVLVSVPGRAALVGHLWLVLVLAIALGAALGALLRAMPRRPSAFDAAITPTRRGHARPASLDRIERAVALANGTAFDVHYRLRPAIHAIASGLLHRHGVDLERTPERARQVVGPDVWELIRPDRPAPDDRTGPGLEVEAIERAVADLERLAWS